MIDTVDKKMDVKLKVMKLKTQTSMHYSLEKLTKEVKSLINEMELNMRRRTAAGSDTNTPAGSTSLVGHDAMKASKRKTLNSRPQNWH